MTNLSLVSKGTRLISGHRQVSTGKPVPELQTTSPYAMEMTHKIILLSKYNVSATLLMPQPPLHSRLEPVSNESAGQFAPD